VPAFGKVGLRQQGQPQRDAAGKGKALTAIEPCRLLKNSE